MIISDIQTAILRKTAIFGPILTGFFATENHFITGVLMYGLPFIVIVAS